MQEEGELESDAGALLGVVPSMAERSPRVVS